MRTVEAVEARRQKGCIAERDAHPEGLGACRREWYNLGPLIGLGWVATIAWGFHQPSSAYIPALAFSPIHALINASPCTSRVRNAARPRTVQPLRAMALSTGK